MQGIASGRQASVQGVGGMIVRRTNDAYYTPQALADAIWKQVHPHGWSERILEPSVGGGAFLGYPLAEFPQADITALDIDPNAEGLRMVPKSKAVDFLQWETEERFDIIIGNPPFSQAEQHVRKATTLLNQYGRVIFLLRLSFLCSKKRSKLFGDFPLNSLYPVVPRPSFTGNGNDNSEYAVFEWVSGYDEPTIRHLLWHK